MDKYDVGVIGWWYGENYGSMLTYYSLHQTLKKIGCSVLMIHEAVGYGKARVKWSDSIAPMKFAKKYYDYTEQVHYTELSKFNSLCDTFIVGSDQIWNPHIPRVNSDCFLDFTDDDKKRISYATSFGNESVMPSRPQFVEKNKANLQRFDAISVRESYAVDIAREFFGINAIQVIDPVFLPDLSEFLNLSDRASLNIQGEYLLAFILDPTIEKKNVIVKMAKELGLEKIFILTNPYSGANLKAKQILNDSNMTIIKIEEISPENFLYAYKNASYVITDSFHGTCFSYIFRKNFNVFYNQLRGADRFVSLMELLKCENRRIYEDEHIKPDFSSVDFIQAEININKQRTRSLEWLKRVIETPKEKLKQDSIITDAAVYKEPKKIRENSIEAANVNCTGCGACANICPKNAITMKENNEGFLNPYVDYDKCVDCGLCVKKCVDINPQYKNNAEPDCYAMMADDDIRKISSSGGMFTVAAEYIIDNGGYVCGAAFTNDFRVEHIIVNDKNDLSRLRGSKYIQSHTDHILKDIKKLLDNNEIVLFTGMPCQVAGLYSYLGKDYDKLYTIDLLCHGITSYKVFEKYHKDIHGGKPLEKLEFKAKEPWGWHAGVNAYFTDGTKYSEPLERDLYYIAYLQSISKNTTCASCKSNKLPRQGDITIGDFWGINKTDSEMFDNKGTSVVLVNNQKA